MAAIGLLNFAYDDLMTSVRNFISNNLYFKIFYFNI